MRLRLSILLLSLIPLAGCGHYGPWAKDAGSFSSGTAPALDQVASSYTEANTLHTLEEETVLAAKYPVDGYRPGQTSDFIADHDLKSRTATIAVLKEYASLIGDLAAGKRSQEIASKAKTVSTSVAAAKSTTSTKSHALTQQQLNFALSGLDLAMKPLIEHKVHKALPPLIKAADPSVQQICTLLIADITDLRSQAETDNRILLMEQSQFTETNWKTLTAIEQRSEVMKLYAIEADGKKTDSELADVLKALQGVAEAHHRLATGGVK
jgi:hypothetical protein